MAWWTSLLGPLMGSVDKVLDRVIPDKNARAEARELLEIELLRGLQSIKQGQLEINKVEAAHSSIFVAGWRPFIGWVCGVGIAWSFLVQPLASWGLKMWKPELDLPALQTEGLYQLIFAMLGMGGLRTFEKIKGVARSRLSDGEEIEDE